MKHSFKIPYRSNEEFYREAGRAKNMLEINESAGLKYLLHNEIRMLKDYVYEKLTYDLKFTIEKDIYGEYVLTTEA